MGVYDAGWMERAGSLVYDRTRSKVPHLYDVIATFANQLDHRGSARLGVRSAGEHPLLGFEHGRREASACRSCKESPIEQSYYLKLVTS